MVSVLVAPLEPGITEGGSNEQVTPAGGLEQAKVTEPLNPFNPFTAMLEFTELPVITVALLGDAVRAISGSSAALGLEGDHLHDPIPGGG